MIDPFKTYMLVFDTEEIRYTQWNDDFLELMKNIHKYDCWYIIEFEVMEGLNYERRLIARSAYVL